MQTIWSKFFTPYGLPACLSLVMLLANSGCVEQAPLDAIGNRYTTETINALIDDLGKWDAKARTGPPVTDLSDKRRAAMHRLGELGENAIPIIIERLQQLPALEQALMKQSGGEEYNRKMDVLLGQKNDLIVLVAESGNKEHGKLLLSLTDTTVGTGKTNTAGLVLALRGLGARTEEQILLNRLFKSPDDYVTGSGTLLNYLLFRRSESDKALAARVAAWPLESRIKGRAVILGTRLGLKEPILSEIKALLERPHMPSEFRHESYEVSLYLTALAELLPPVDYMAATADAKLLQHKGYASVVRSAQQHNRFWWASAEEKDVLVHQLVSNDVCDDAILALHYMLQNERLDLFMKARLVFDSNVLNRQSQPEIKPYYKIG